MATALKVYLGFLCVVSCFYALVHAQGHLLAQPVTEICLRCLCESISGCNVTARCSDSENGNCGMFRIGYAYWVDAGKLTLEGDIAESDKAFPNCANNPICASHLVQNYMTKFGQDCNGDGEIDCHDYARIHKLGAYGCTQVLPYKFQSNFEECIDQYEEEAEQ